MKGMNGVNVVNGRNVGATSLPCPAYTIAPTGPRSTFCPVLNTARTARKDIRDMSRVPMEESIGR